MKKFLFFSAMALTTTLVNAQRTDWGIKGGMNITNLSYENTTNPDARVSGNFGLLAHIHVARQFAVQPELMFSGQGASETIAGKDYRLALNYINLPVLGQIMFNRGWRLETGPQFGLLASAKLKSGGNSETIKDGYNTFDFSWVFGLGYLFRSGFGVDARYNLGISNINDDGGGSIRNRVFQAGIFYQFRGR